MSDPGSAEREQEEQRERARAPAPAPDLSAVERLREVVLDLERAKETERALREEASALLAGLRAIAEAHSAEELFARLLEVMRAPLGSDVALVLRDLDGRGQGLAIIASTDAALLGHPVPLGKTFARALGGRVTTLLDASVIPELRTPPFDVVGSAVLMPLASERSRALILFGCRARHAFQPRHEQLVKRLAPLANQALREVERAAVIARQHHEMRLVLDHIDQGLVMLDLEGRLVGERSRQLERWFGTTAPATFAELIERHSAEQAAWLELALANLRDGFMPAEICLEQMPRRLEASGRVFDLAYRTVMDGEQLHRILVVISDVTLRLARQRTHREQRELVGIFQRIIDDRAGVEELLAEATELIASLAVAREPINQRRILHTLKGNCALFGLELFSEHCHALESELAESLQPVSEAQRRALLEAWQAPARRVAELLGASRSDVVEIPLAELTALLERGRHGDGGLSDDAAAALRRWTLEPVQRRFRRLAEYAQTLSRRLGKGELEITASDGGVRIDGASWAPFWSVAAHAVRNALDHGLEPPDERLRRAKPPAGRLTFTAEQVDGWISITIADDGRGIDWEALRVRARAAGLPHASREELIGAMFTDGITTREVASHTSGRGVGLAALRQVVSEMGGRIDVVSMHGAGTRITCRMPELAGGGAARRPEPQRARGRSGGPGGPGGPAAVGEPLLSGPSAAPSDPRSPAR